MMRPQSIVSEALANLASGTTRGALLTLVFSVLVGGLALVDLAVVAGEVEAAASFRGAGASVQTLKVVGGIDPARCEALGGAAPIQAAGALRQGESIQPKALPGSELTTWEVTPGLLALLPPIAGVDTGQAAAGLWISADLAETLGVRPGERLNTYQGQATVAAVFEWPDDGRLRDLGYSVLAPVVPDGPFTQCWAEVWPSSDAAASLLRLALNTRVDPQQVVQSQLNASLGVDLDVRARIADRVSRRAGAIAAAVGAILGLASLRLRRLEVASALHAGVAKTDLIWQHAVETAGWAVPGLVICFAAVAVLSYSAGAGAQSALLVIGSATVLAGFASAFWGAAAGVCLIRERHLFKLFRER
ncbi:MAG: hypothetical protein LBD90_09030 [Bifidobacteriaceae bacterium]|jgi:hypothetical protein|nr:hypothetical protein [Bifidobacteriaceae bacterium]